MIGHKVLNTGLVVERWQKPHALRPQNWFHCDTSASTLIEVLNSSHLKCSINLRRASNRIVLTIATSDQKFPSIYPLIAIMVGWTIAHDMLTRTWCANLVILLTPILCRWRCKQDPCCTSVCSVCNVSKENRCKVVGFYKKVTGIT